MNIYSAFADAEGPVGMTLIEIAGMGPVYTPLHVWRHTVHSQTDNSKPNVQKIPTVDSPPHGAGLSQTLGDLQTIASPYARAASNKAAGTLGTLAELSKESQANSGSVPRLSVSSRSPRNKSLNAVMRNSWRVLEPEDEVHFVAPTRTSFPRGAGNAFGPPSRAGRLAQKSPPRPEEPTKSVSPQAAVQPTEAESVAKVSPDISPPRADTKTPVSLDVSFTDPSDPEKLVLPLGAPPTEKRIVGSAPLKDQLRSSMVLKPQKLSTKTQLKAAVVNGGGGVSSAIKLLQNQYRHKKHSAAKLPHQKTHSVLESATISPETLDRQTHLTQDSRLKETLTSPKDPTVATSNIIASATTKQKAEALLKQMATIDGRTKTTKLLPNPSRPDPKPKTPFFSKPRPDPQSQDALSERRSPHQHMAAQSRLHELQKSASVKNMNESAEPTDLKISSFRVDNLQNSVRLNTASLLLSKPTQKLPFEVVSSKQKQLTAQTVANQTQAHLGNGLSKVRDISRESHEKKFTKQFASRSMAKIIQPTIVAPPSRTGPTTTKAKTTTTGFLFATSMWTAPNSTLTTSRLPASPSKLSASQRAGLEFERKKNSYLKQLGVSGVGTPSNIRHSVSDSVRVYFEDPQHREERLKALGEYYYVSGVVCDYLKQTGPDTSMPVPVGELKYLDHLSSNISSYFTVCRAEKMQSSRKKRNSSSGLHPSTAKKLLGFQQDRSKLYQTAGKQVATGTRGAQVVGPKKMTLIFDMDETLLHCPLERDGSGAVDKITPSQLNLVKFVLRPHVVEGLQTLKAHFCLGLFTSSDQSYADTALQRLNLDLFDFKLYRQHCKEISNSLYVKDLRAVSPFCDPDSCFLIDNNMYCYSPQLTRGVPILPFYGDKTDTEFGKLTKYLQLLGNCGDPLKFNTEYFGYDLLTGHGDISAAKIASELAGRLCNHLKGKSPSP